MISYDESKRRANLAKHGIDLASVEPIFDHPMLTREDDREDYGEQRLISLGLLDDEAVVLVWTDRDDAGAHIISCRKAERHEKKIYQQRFQGR